MKSALLSIALLVVAFGFASAFPADTLKYGIFGKVVVYKPTSTIESVVIFISGDGGLNKGVAEIGRSIVSQGALVAGIDIKVYNNNLKKRNLKCYYPAADFEELSLELQKLYKLPQYQKPILIGYSSGATLVYGILVQAPANTFKGAIALGFCPDIEINKPLCTGSGLKQHVLKPGLSYYLEACNTLTAPFIVLNGIKDKTCNFAATKEFMKGINTGSIYELPAIAHGFSQETVADWRPQYIEAYKRILQYPSFAQQKMTQNKLLQAQKLKPLPGDFPVIAIPAASDDSLPMVFLISGDGGWTGFDHSLGESLAQKGMPVIGLDAQKYFWNAKTPQETAAEVSLAVRHYMQQWGKKKFILAGYSFGACVIPFIADRLPADLKETLSGVYCLSPDLTADFEIHLSDMLNLGIASNVYNVTNEIKKINGLHPVCIFGKAEDAGLRKKFTDTGARIITIPGNHHYNNDPSAAAEAIRKDAKSVKSK